METEEEERMIAAFKDVAGEEMDDETCRALLSSNDWNLESTLRNFFEAPTSPAAQGTPIHEENITDSDERAAFLDEGVRSRRRGISPDREGFHGMHGRSRISVPPPAQPTSFMRLLKEMLTGQPQESSASSARRFIADFDRIVGSGSVLPEFFESSFDDALLSASTERKLFAVYLHSPLHPNTGAFCKDILCSRPVLNAISDNVRLWGGSVENSEGYLASAKVQAAGFPCLVLISTANGRDAKVLDRIYMEDPSEVNLADKIGARIVAAKNNRSTATQRPEPRAVPSREVDERRRVMQEQDEALQSAIEEDRKKQEEKKRKEEEEAERARRLEEEEELRTKELERKRARIEPEPGAKEPGTAVLRFHFPDGSKISRRFNGSDTIGYVRNVLDVHLNDVMNLPKLRYGLAMFPKEALENNEVTLKEAGLVPQSVVYVQDLDA